MIPALAVPMLVLVVAAQALRWWCIVSLGPRWNTRVVIVPGLPRVTRGPYAVATDTPTTWPSWSRGSPCHWSDLPGSRHCASRAERRAADRADPHGGRRAEPAAGPHVVIDLIVAGGGPVGLATAITAALAGLDVVVVEPRTGIIDKACGEGLMPRRLARLHALGIEPDGIDLAGIRYLSGSRDGRGQFSAGPGAGCGARSCMRRYASRALDVGVRILPGQWTRWRRPPTACTPPVGRRGTWSQLMACTRRCAARSGWRPARRRGASVRSAPALPGCSRVGPCRGALAARPGGVRHAGGPDTVGVAVLGPGPAGPQSAIAASRPWPMHLCGATGRARCGEPARSAKPPPHGSPAGCCWSATRRATSTR